MKKIVIILAMLSQSVFVLGENKKRVDIVRAKTDSVKLYLQPGTAAPVLESLNTSEDIIYIRKYNSYWSIVVVNDKPGYILTSELVSDRTMVYFSNGRVKQEGGKLAEPTKKTVRI
jgi:hypothetical protein